MSTTVVAINGFLESEFFDIHSAIVGDTFRIFVAKPPFAPEGRHPAIYVADGNTLFAQVMGIHRTLAWGAESPAAYVIGIGYPTDDGFLGAISKRNRDYAPTDGGNYAREVLRSRETAGSAAYLRFLSDELKPALEARYAIDSGNATFVGVSLGGLFGAWALLQNTPLFQRYILCSPAIWWNDEEVWQWEQACAAQAGDLRATVFICAGGLEFAAAMREHAFQIAANNPLLKPQIEATIAWHDNHGWPRTTDLVQEFADKLGERRYASLRIHCHNMPEETHMSIAPAAICRGLRYVFDHWRPW
jgi:predicted alpha/beta superfamily hydrolase